MGDYSVVQQISHLGSYLPSDFFPHLNFSFFKKKKNLLVASSVQGCV